jgi:hypothetical protein
LVATPLSSTQIALSWSSTASNVTGFRIERCTGSGCSGFVTVGETTRKTFTDSGLTGSTIYGYRVRAFNAAGQSSPSNVAEVLTPAPPPPPGPIQLDVTTGNSSVSVTWSSTTITRTVRLQQWTGSGWSVVQQTSGQSSGAYSVPSPVQSSVYAFRAQHFDDANNVVATSNTDAALLTTFTDDPLAAGMKIKAVHVTQLVTATNQYRAAFGLAPISIPNAAAGNVIRAADIVTLRTAINEARTTAGMAAIAFPSITPRSTKIRAADVQQLRAVLR